MTELLRAEGLSRRFRDGTWGLRGVDLAVREGDFLVLAGPNGSGKSLLVRSLVGLARPTEGRVLYRGRPIQDDLRLVRSKVGLVFQDTESQILGRTVLDDAAFGPANLRLGASEVDSRARAALAAAGLEDKEARRPDTLSGGERRRLAVAGVLAMDSECVILDEPFANLDYPSIVKVLELIVGLHARGRTIVLLTHELEKCLAHATRLCVMGSGRVAYDGDPDGFPADGWREAGLMDPYRGGLQRADLTWTA